MAVVTNNRQKWLFVMVVTVASICVSVLVTWIITPEGMMDKGLIIALIVPAIVAPIASYVSANMMLRIYRLNEHLDYLAHHDQMTGLLNRKAFFDGIADRTKADLPTGSVIIADIDKFKAINDTYGHQVGDYVICKVADILKAQSQADGIAARFGGEEFVAFYPRKCISEATRRAEQIRTAIEDEQMRVQGNSLSCTLSIGVAFCDGDKPIDDYLRAADEALYAAKKGGRNRVIRHQDRRAPDPPARARYRRDARPA